MHNAARAALAAAEIVTDRQAYRLIHLPPTAITPAAAVVAAVGEAFVALLADKDEVTLVLPDLWWHELQSRLPEHKVAEEVYHLLTFDLSLQHNLVGFMAIVSAALAEAGIPLMAYSAFERDHLLIQARYFEQACAVLTSLQGTTR
ncbi:MAG: hypothetical protein Kow0077_18380 [Anaerolineae bacterium]